MIELITYWTPVVTGLTTFTTFLLKIIELLGNKERIVEILKGLPYLLKLLAKFLIYGLSLIIPNIGMIWLFFYQTGISPNRLSETEFFWAIVAQPTLGVSIYAYIWGKWIYPKLQSFLESNPPQEPKHEVSTSKKSSKNGGKKK